jgi:tetratricopeptide (TPR) repeat protein
MELSKEALEAMLSSAAAGMTPERALELSGKLYATGLGIAADFYSRNRIAEAAETYAQLILVRPDRSDGYIGLGHCLLDLDDPLKAFEIAGRITTIAPENASGWFIAGKALFMLGCHEPALDDFLTAEDCARETGHADLLEEIERFRAVAEAKLAAADTEDA